MAENTLRNMVVSFGESGAARVATNTSKAAGAMRLFGSRAAGATAALGGLRGAAGAAGGALGALAGAAAIGAAVKSFADLDEALTKSQAIMGDLSDNTLARMESRALEVSTQMQFSAEEAAESFFFLSSAGLDAEQSIRALGPVSQFAQAGLFSMQEATELLTDAQSALGLSSDNAAQNMKNMRRVADVLVAANTEANATVRQFAQALTNRAAPAMRSMNIEMEEGVAVLAAFADQGLKGRRAGTFLARTLRILSQQAGENREAFEQLGIVDAEGNIRNLATVLRILEAELEGTSDATKAARLEQIGFTARVQAAIKPLIGMSDEVARYQRNLHLAQGTTREIADEQMNTLNKQMGLLWDNTKRIAKGFGSLFEPAVMGATRAANMFFSTLNPQRVAKVTSQQLAFLAGVRGIEQSMRETAGQSTILRMNVAEMVAPFERINLASMDMPSIWDVIKDKLNDATSEARSFADTMQRVLGMSREAALRLQVLGPTAMAPGRGILGGGPAQAMGRRGRLAEAATVGTRGLSRRVQTGGLPAGRQIPQEKIPDATSAINEALDGASGFRDALLELGPAFSQLITRAFGASSAIGKVANTLFQVVTGFLRGGPLGAVSGIVSGFAGFFQHGGTIPRGQFGIAGEAGPELVSGGATVTPLEGGLTAQIQGPEMSEPTDQRQAARDREWQEFLGESMLVFKQRGGEV